MTKKEYIDFYRGVMNNRVKNNPLTAGGDIDYYKGGKIQLQFLIDNGLKPEHTLLDIGCGCLTLANQAIPYLDEYNYFGIDISLQAMEKGVVLIGEEKYNRIGNLVNNTNFKFEEEELEVKIFDFVFAFSVINHLPIEHFDELLENIQTFIHDKTVILLTVWLDEKTRPHRSGEMNHYTLPKSHDKPNHKPTSWYYSLKDMNEICYKYGFQMQQIETLTHWNDPPLLRLKMIKITRMNK